MCSLRIRGNSDSNHSGIPLYSNLHLCDRAGLALEDRLEGLELAVVRAAIIITGLPAAAAAGGVGGHWRPQGDPDSVVPAGGPFGGFAIDDGPGVAIQCT